MVTFAGLQVEIVRPVITRRSWKERWLTRPWHPFQKTKVRPPSVPEGQVFRIGDTWLMTEGTWDGLKKELDSENTRFFPYADSSLQGG